MASKYGSLGIQADVRYRTIPETQIVEVLMLAGWAYEADTRLAGESCKKALLTWTELGLGSARAPNGERLFDPVEVLNFLKRACLDGRDDFWARTYVPTGRRLVSDLSDVDPARLGPDGARRFRVDFTRTFNLRSFPTGKNLRLRMPLPLTGDSLKDLSITPSSAVRRGGQYNVRPGSMELRMVTCGEPEVDLGATLSFTALPQRPCPASVLADPERTLYLNDREGLIVVTERIRALAQSLAGRGAPALEAVRAFWDYINGNLNCGALHYDQIDLAAPCDWVLDSGWFDCRMGSSLFVALCRAHGIPARLIGGHMLHMIPTNHYWAEAWIDDRGWTPFDFLSWDLSQGGRDPAWRDHYFGLLDYRLITERLPRDFTGALGVPIPPAWCILQRQRPGGVEISFLSITGEPVYIDTIRVSE